MFNKMIVTAKIAQTLDGKIATATGKSKWITSDATRRFSRYRRDRFDAILVGVNTALKDNPLLTGVKNKKLKKVIVDTHLKLSAKAKLFEDVYPGQCIVATTSKASLKKIKLFEQKGTIVWICPLANNQVNLKFLYKKLARAGVKRLLIEGGATIIGSALKAGIVDKVNIYLAPTIMGDQSALSSIVGFRTKQLDKMVKLANLKIQRLSTDLLIEANVSQRKK